MQWSGEVNAGFTSKDVTPWMRVHDDYKEKNVEVQLRDPDSLLCFWRKILELRKEYRDFFVYGRYELVESGKNLFVFSKKEAGGRKSLTVVNFSGSRKGWDGPDKILESNLKPILGEKYKLLIGTVERGDNKKLAPWEGRVYIQTS